jgi:hypothetical protein
MKRLSICFSSLLTVAIAVACAQTPTTGEQTAKATDTFWLYKAGKFKGPGDYSYGTGRITYGSSTVMVTGDEAWQPRMPHDDINTGPYTYLTVSIKPTQPQTWISGMLMIGDVAIPGSNGAVDLSPYGPNPAIIGEWNVYKIPLTAYGIKLGSGLHVYKVMFQSQNVASPSTNKVEYDAVGLVP